MKTRAKKACIWSGPAIVTLALSLCMAIPATGQEVEVVTEPAQTETNGGVTAVQGISVTENPDSNLISIQLDEVKLVDVLRLFTRLSGANIVSATTNLTGTVSANLKDVEWQPALLSILELHNLTLVERSPDSKIYMVKLKPSGAQESKVSEIIDLGYARVSNVVGVVSQLLGTAGSLQTYTPGNALVVNAPEERIREVQKIIRTLDRQAAQVYIETRFVQLESSKGHNLGINWNSLKNYQVTASQMAWAGERVGTRETMNTDGQISQNLNMTGLQGPYDQVTEYSKEFLSEPGRASYGDIGTEKIKGATVPTLLSRAGAASSLLSGMYATNILTAILTPDDFSVVLSALNTLEGLTTISNPKLIVANEQTATIKMATDEPNVKISVQRGNAQLGQNDLYTSELDSTTPYFTYGITVDVTPRININGDISVKITPTLSHKIERETKIVGSNAYPVIASRTLDTQFTLGNGRTAAIGGLTSVGDNDVRSKIPVLGDIPLIGKYLFSHTSKVREQKEIIIFVTCNTTDSQTERNAGVPDDSLLIYRQQEQDRKRRIELDAEMKARAEAAAAETNAPARKPKKATFKDSPMYDLPLDGI